MNNQHQPQTKKIEDVQGTLIEEKNEAPKKKLEVKDASKLDQKIPKGLLIKYGENWYILKAGLEWKANKVYGAGDYSITLEIIERSPDYVLARAIFTSKTGSVFSNYGEASKANVKNSLMHSQLTHLALTRAECRVLRMATACGYVSAEELDHTGGEQNKVNTFLSNDPITDAQKSTLQALGEPIEKISTLTMSQAAELIKNRSMGKIKGKENNHA